MKNGNETALEALRCCLSTSGLVEPSLAFGSEDDVLGGGDIFLQLFADSFPRVVGTVLVKLREEEFKNTTCI